MVKECGYQGCPSRHYCRGWCVKHYQRWRKKGYVYPDPVVLQECTVEACVDSPRTTFAEFCEKHYMRIRRTGSIAAPAPPLSERACEVDDCDRPAEREATRMCRLHHMRTIKHGDPHYKPVGENNTQWTGDNATYTAAHQRLRVARGSASDHDCVQCGTTAAHWAYDRADPDEIAGGKGPYSLDNDHYRPMCVRCHKIFDMACIAGRIDPMDLAVRS